MTVFITGGCKNGKSTFAVQRAMELGEKRFYVATMLPRDAEDTQRVAYHRAKRAGLGFTTVESSDLVDVSPEPGGVYLVDSITALVQNAMFPPDGSTNPHAAEEVLPRLKPFFAPGVHAVFVSDFLYSNCAPGQGDTAAYMANLAAVERFLAQSCDKTFEICAATAQERRKTPFGAAKMGAEGAKGGKNPAQGVAKCGQSGAKRVQSVDKVVEGVEFVLGGAHQGKLEYVQKTYGLTREQVFFCDESGEIDRTKPCVYGLETYISACLRHGIEPNLDFSAQTAVVMTDIFCGLVPLEPSLRQWREACGHAAAKLAAEAARVTRLFCGLSQSLK